MFLVAKTCFMPYKQWTEVIHKTVVYSHCERASTPSLSSLSQCLTTLSVKNFFLMSNPNPLFQFKVITPCSITVCHCEKSLSSSPFSFWKAAFGALSFPSWTTQLSQPLHIWEAIQTVLIIFLTLLWTCSSRSTYFFMLVVSELGTILWIGPHYCGAER